jgi:hypothetical protein
LNFIGSELVAAKYKVTLQLNNPYESDQVQKAHIGHAKDAAKWHSVKGGDQNDLDETQHRDPKGTGTKPGNTIIWHVYGEFAQVVAMCNRWEGSADVDDKGVYWNKFTPTVTVVGPPLAE